MTVASFSWNDRAVRRALGLRDVDDTEEADGPVFARVSTDSRTTEDGDLYVALSGERFDGHDFVAEALARGARGAVVARPVVGAESAVLYAVDDTLVALGALARFRRRALPARVVGITGSSGKTTTKDLTGGALGGALRVHATTGNLNNRIGVPLTLLSAPPDAEVLVVEMGTNEPGEIAILAGIAEPDVAVVTTVSESHLEKLGSLEGVLDEKLDLVRSLAESALAAVGDEPPRLAQAARSVHGRVRVAGFSDEADDDLRPLAVEVDHWGRYTFRWKGKRVSLTMPGRHVVVNALLGLAVAEELGVPAGAATKGVSSVPPGAMRGEVRQLGTLTLILDCYNANPQSVRAALELLEHLGHGVRRVAILGSMLELGGQSESLHQAVANDAASRNIDVLVATGAFAAAVARLSIGGDSPGPTPSGPTVISDVEPEAAYHALRDELRGDEVVLLKASRGVALESLVPLFERDFGEAA